MLGLIRRFLNHLAQKRAKRKHDALVNEYRHFATAFGDALSYGYLGEANIQVKSGRWLNEKECWNELDRLEVEYATLGYRIIDINDWIGYGGYGKNIKDLWLVKRESNERPVFTKELIERQKHEVKCY